MAQRSLEVLTDEGAGGWQLGQEYRFRIELTPGRIEGAIHDGAGSTIVRRAFRLDDDATAVGRPVLRVDGTETRFTDLRVAVGKAAVKPADIAHPPFQSAPPMAGITGRRTGYFRVEGIADRWWVFDPNGAATLGLSVDHVKYSGPWCTALNKYPYKANNDATYASRAEWEKQALQRLKAWKFNLIPIGGDPSLRQRGMAHCSILNVGYRFAALGDAHDTTPYRGHPGSVFPNVFHPDFRAWLDFYMGEYCAPTSTDPWLFGYFLDNELAWGGKKHGVWHGMFDAMLLKSADHTGKIALRDHLRDEYGTVAKLNSAWSVDVTSWDDVLFRTALGSNDNAETVRVKEGFLAKAAETYFRLITEAIRKHDPNHMIIGSRFAGGQGSEAIWGSCGKYCDIESVDGVGGLTSQVSIDGLNLGHYNTMVCQLSKGRKWCGVDRLENACVRVGENGMEIELTGSWGKTEGDYGEGQAFEVCQSLTVLPGKPWFVVRIDWVRNVSDKPLNLHSLYFRTHSAIRGQMADDTPSAPNNVPRLWKGNASSAWMDPKGGFFGIVAPGGGESQVRFWLDDNGVQHPDAWTLTRATIAPGETWRPERSVWMVVVMGKGGPQEWKSLSRELSR